MADGMPWYPRHSRGNRDKSIILLQYCFATWGRNVFLKIIWYNLILLSYDKTVKTVTTKSGVFAAIQIHQNAYYAFAAGEPRILLAELIGLTLPETQ